LTRFLHVSYVLVISIGLRLLFVKGRSFLIAARQLRTRHDLSAAAPSMLSGRLFHHRGASAIGCAHCEADGHTGHHGFHCHDDRGMLAMRWIEVSASVLIVAFAALLLAGYMASERLWMFTG